MLTSINDSSEQVAPARSVSVNVMFSAEMAWDKHCGGETPAFAHTHHIEGGGNNIDIYI